MTFASACCRAIACCTWYNSRWTCAWGKLPWVAGVAAVEPSMFASATLALGVLPPPSRMPPTPPGRQLHPPLENEIARDESALQACRFFDDHEKALKAPESYHNALRASSRLQAAKRFSSIRSPFATSSRQGRWRTGTPMSDNIVITRCGVSVPIELQVDILHCRVVFGSGTPSFGGLASSPSPQWCVHMLGAFSARGTLFSSTQ